MSLSQNSLIGWECGVIVACSIQFQATKRGWRGPGSNPVCSRFYLFYQKINLYTESQS